MKNMTSENCTYTDINGGKTSVYKFTKDRFNIVPINMNDIKYQHPTGFIHMIGDDEAVNMTQYHRYHDYICSDNKTEDFNKLMCMYNIYWELNDQYMIITDDVSEIFSRTNQLAMH